MSDSIFSLTVAAAALLGGAAHAAPPANIANTSWTLHVNRGAAERLVIDTQAGAGAPGNSVCRAITGNLAGFVPVNGWYCPASGEIRLLHRNVATEVVVRAFSGNVSDDVAGEPLYLAGTVAIFAAPFGDLGERNFAATQQ